MQKQATEYFLCTIVDSVSSLEGGSENINFHDHINYLK